MGLNLKYIKARRMELGLSQQEAAEAAGMETKVRWNELEAGRRPNPTLDTLKGISKALKCNVEDLIIQ